MTATAAEAYTTEQTARQQGVSLLDGLLARLVSTEGYLKVAIDTYRNPHTLHTVRHSYCNNEWTLTCGYEGGGWLEVRYSTRATMPSVDELLLSVGAPPF